MAPYNPNIPQGTDFIDQSQQQILDNFDAINTLVGVNLYDFSSGYSGKIQYLQLPIASAAPNTGANELSIYNALGVYSGINELYLQKKNNGKRIAWTESSQATIGWTFLPSGILMKWGTLSTSADTYTVVFPAGASIPAFSAVYSVQVTVIGDNSPTPNRAITVVGSSVTTTQFKVYGSQRTTQSGRNPVTFCYLVIGIN